MATPPTRVTYTTPAVGYGSTATPKTTPTFNVTNGDLLTVVGSSENDATTLNTPTATGGSITWTLRQSIIVSGYCNMYVWTGEVGATATGITVSVARSSGSGQWSFGVTVWRDHGGYGTSAKTNVSSGAPSLAMTCSANSAVVTGSDDWNAGDGTSRTWRTVNGSAITESLYFRNSSSYTVYSGYVADVGTAGSKTFGLTAPGSQKYSIIAIEVLGLSGASLALAGSAESTSTTTGAIARAHPLAGAANSASSTTAVQTAVLQPSGAANSASSTTAVQTAILTPSGQASSTSSTTADQVLIGVLDGSASSTSSTTADLGLTSGGTDLALAGSAESTSSTTAAVTQTGALAGSAESTSSTTGVVGRVMSLSGSAESTSSTSGAVANVRPYHIGSARTGTTAGSSTTSTVTVPAGVTTADYGILVFAASHPTLSTSVSVSGGSVTSSEVFASTQASNVWYNVRRIGNVAAGEVLTITTNVANLAAAAIHFFSKDFTVGTVGNRGGVNQAYVDIPSMATEAGRRSYIVAADRTTATHTFSSATNANGATVTELFFSDPGLSNEGNVGHYLGTFVTASGSTTGTSTATWASGSTNAFGFHITEVADAALSLSGSANSTSTTTAELTLDSPPVATVARVTNTVLGELRAGWWITSGDDVRMVVSTSSDLSSPTYSSTVSPAPSGGVTAKVSGLTQGVQYYIGIEVDGDILDTGRAQARTLQVNRSIGSWSFAAGSCQNTGSTRDVFTKIGDEDYEFFAHMGDMHYADTSTEATWRAAYKSSLTSSTMQDLVTATPVSWTPDNHDWGGNRSWRETSVADFAYDAVVETAGDYAAAGAFYRTYTHRGVRFIELDRWSQRDKDTNGTESDGGTSTAKANNASDKVMLGATQEAWFLDLLENSTEHLIVVFSGFPLTNARLQYFEVETTRIRNAINALPASQKNKIVAIGGDSHDIRAATGAASIALWDIPTLNASPLHQVGSPFDTTGWDIGYSDVDDDFGYWNQCTITDDGDTMTFRWDAMSSDGTVSVLDWELEVPAGLALSGSAASTSSTSGVVTATQRVAGAANSTSSTTGVVTAILAPSGTAASTSTTTADLRRTITGLAGSAESASSTSGVVTAILRPSGSAESVSSTTGLQRLLAALSGAANSTSTTTALISIAGGPVDHPLSGSANSSSSTTGVVTAILRPAGVASSVSSTAAIQRALLVISGAAQSASTTTGGITIPPRDPLTLQGSAASASQTLAAMRALLAAQGLAVSESATTGLLTSTLSLTGLVASGSTTSGQIWLGGPPPAVDDLRLRFAGADLPWRFDSAPGWWLFSDPVELWRFSGEDMNRSVLTLDWVYVVVESLAPPGGQPVGLHTLLGEIAAVPARTKPSDDAWLTAEWIGEGTKIPLRVLYGPGADPMPYGLVDIWVRITNTDSGVTVVEKAYTLSSY